MTGGGEQHEPKKVQWTIEQKAMALESCVVKDWNRQIRLFPENFQGNPFYGLSLFASYQQFCEVAFRRSTPPAGFTIKEFEKLLLGLTPPWIKKPQVDLVDLSKNQ